MSKENISNEKILAYALENALLHKGKAQEQSVLPKLFMEGLSKSDIPKIMPLVKKIVDSVNKMSEEEQKEKFQELQHLVRKVEHKERLGLEELPDAREGKVVMRFRPSPSGPLHIGHSLVLGLNSLYCKKYNGRLYVVIDDTNPENIHVPAYKLIEEEVKWMHGSDNFKVTRPSDNLKIYYKYAEKLIKMDKAYICNCKPEHFRDYVTLGRACPCRHKSMRKNLQDWKKMFKESEYTEGQAVLRIKTDLKAKNPALREWPAFRICDSEHPRTKKKYRVWPLMNFSVVVDDIEQGVTHVIRGKDHLVNTERQLYVYDYLKVKPPVFMHLGLINFEGIHLSTTETRKSIEEKRYTGWNDIRLPFLEALKKRGLQPGAFLKFAENTGLSDVDKTVPYEEFMLLIYAFNKPFIENASRYFFIANPIKITIKNAPKLEAEISLHPQHKERGARRFKTEKEFYIAKQDFENIEEGRIYRLMNLFNFEKKGREFLFHSKEHNADLKAIMMHWLPAGRNIRAKVLMLNNEHLEGVAEPDATKLKEGAIVQFERFAFCRLIKKTKQEMEFWFTQK